MTDGVVLFTKVPIPGTVKTRLIPRLGPAGAARLHAALVDQTLLRLGDLPLTIALSGPLDHPWARALARRAPVLPQGEGDLGQRLARHLLGNSRRVAIGSDCPLFDPADLAAALAHPADLALGPADDGGYWCVAVGGPNRRDAAPIFEGIPWSTPQTLAVTLDRAAAAGLTVARLPPCYDIDAPADLDRLAADPRCPPPLLSLLGPADAPRH